MCATGCLCWTCDTHHSEELRKPQRLCPAVTVKRLCVSGGTGTWSGGCPVGGLWFSGGYTPSLNCFRLWVGAVEVPGNQGCVEERRCVAYKNYPILEIRSLMGMDPSGHLWDMASSEILTAIVCLDFILLQRVGHCPAGRPEHCSPLAMTQRSSNLHKNLTRYF